MSSYYTPEQAAQINWDRRWQSYGIPTRFWGHGLTDMDRRPAIATALDQASQIVVTWPLRHPTPADRGGELVLPEDRSLLGRGQVIIGAAGVGKTRLVCATATTIARWYNTSVLYMPVTKYFSIGREISQATDLAVKLKDEESLNRVRRLTRLQRLVITVPLLIWDDVGKEYTAASGWNGSEVYRVLRERFDHHRPTLMTTNVPLPEWAEKYEGAMFSFLHEAFDAAAIRGDDQRRAKR